MATTITVNPDALQQAASKLSQDGIVVAQRVKRARINPRSDVGSFGQPVENMLKSLDSAFLETARNLNTQNQQMSDLLKSIVSEFQKIEESSMEVINNLDIEVENA